MVRDTPRDPDTVWLDYLQPVGLVVAPVVLKEFGLTPVHQTPVDSAAVGALLSGDDSRKPPLSSPWAFVELILGWEAANVAGAPGGPPIPPELSISLPEQRTVLAPSWAIVEPGSGGSRWQLLARIEAPGVDPDIRNSLDGWEATPHQRFERLLRDSGVYAGVLITDEALRLVYAPRGETSGYLSFPLRALATVAGRPMLAGLKLLLDSSALFTAAESHRLPALLRKSRDTQALVSAALAEQVLGALHELLRGIDAAEPELIRRLAAENPDHLYEGLLSLLMRLVFILYAEDRDLLPSRQDERAREVYEGGYSLRGLYARLVQDAALNPDTMDERRGGWGRLIALFRLIHKGHSTNFVRARAGKLFDPDEYPFLEGRATKDAAPRIANVSDGCLFRILEGLMTLEGRKGVRERLSYRTLDVEQIGSVYETVMGFTVKVSSGPSLAIKAGKNNRTPVFVPLKPLLSRKGKDRIKELKEAGRGQLSAGQVKGIEAADSVESLAVALDGIVDERASPMKRAVPTNVPILQPTDERRRTGSHYTPRSLTAPIVQHALEPAFQRLGPDATPAQVLDLRVCDLAMGSGAFLVEACRALAARLTLAWTRYPDQRPPMPADEDDELLARRLVAQHCLYGVDRNPRAVDLARLSLWLATLARDHEFTFLDHALKCGDSLVGLTTKQIFATHWDQDQAPSFVGRFVSDHLREAEKARNRIRDTAEGATEAELRPQLRAADARLAVARLIGDGVIAAFFSAGKQKTRVAALVRFQQAVQNQIGSLHWDKAVAPLAASLQSGEHPIQPFHWQIEFPEVFSRPDGGFDAVVGNPPFAGKNTIIAGNRPHYLDWLQTLHPGSHGNSDLVAHFFRRAFDLLRQNGVFGLIATNTIGQGDTRASGLTPILAVGGSIARAIRRVKWPGEAAVVVSVVHAVKGPTTSPVLDDRPVRRISAYLVEGDLDASPAPLVASSNKAFIGSYLLGMGFTFDDEAAAKGEAESLATMRALIEKAPGNGDRISPYIGGDEVNNDPQHSFHRYAIDFFNRPLARRSELKSWPKMTAAQRSECLTRGEVPTDYPLEVAEDRPDLIAIVRRLVKPERDKQKRKALKDRWWQYAEKRPGLYQAIEPLPTMFVLSRVSPQFAIARLPTKLIPADSLVVFALPTFASFAALQSRTHELWARFFSSSMKDDLRYAPSDCFRTFPFPDGCESDGSLEEAGEAYHSFRAKLMIDRNEGLTKTYNRFHARTEKSADIEQLRALHHEMDLAVLHAYGWKDLAERAAPEFTEQDLEEERVAGKAPKTRLDWPAEFKDELLARLLALNVERAAAERAAGVRALDGEEELSEDASDDFALESDD